MFTSALYIVLSTFVASCSTFPIANAGPSATREFIQPLPIARRSFRQKPPVHDSGSIQIFDDTFPKRELQGIIAKYEQASQFLRGVGLAPEQNITSWYPDSSPLGILSAESTSDAPPAIIPPVFVSAGTGVQSTKDYISGNLDVLYYGPLQFGTPAQTLMVDIDTGSADLWVPVNCPNCINKEFDARASSTYRNRGDKFSVTYGSGSVSGTLATDVVSVAGLTVEEQAFGAVNRESEDFNGYPNDGLIGMAFGTIAQSRKPTLIENLIQEKKLAAPLFSIHLARNQETGSEVCFGCYDSTKTTGPVSWVPVKSKTYWSVEMDSLAINSTSAVSTDIVAAIDTGTTLIYVPDDVAVNFYGLIPGAKPAPEYGPEFYTYPCSAKLDIAFSFGGQSFSLNPFDFNLGRTSPNSTDCVGGILSLGNDFPSNLAIIGDEFLKSWYSTFDYSNGARVGFSPSVNNKANS